MTKIDMVNHPPHYTAGPFESITLIDTFNMSFCVGNAFKYLMRCNSKAPKGRVEEDLNKAEWYLMHEIMLQSKNVTTENMLKDSEVMRLRGITEILIPYELFLGSILEDNQYDIFYFIFAFCNTNHIDYLVQALYEVQNVLGRIEIEKHTSDDATV